MNDPLTKSTPVITLDLLEKDQSGPCCSATNSKSESFIDKIYAFDSGYTIEIEEVEEEDLPRNYFLNFDGYSLLAIPDQPGVKVSVVNLEERLFLAKYVRS